MKMSKEKIFAIIDDELEKRKNNTFLLWDFPNDVKKRIEELYQSIDNAKPSEALRELNIIRHLEIGFDKNGKSITLNDIEGLNTIKQALLKAQEQESENKDLLEENKDLYFELALAEKQYKESIECVKQYKRTLEIIKEKNVDIFYLKIDNTVEEYNSHFISNEPKLTQEEFELLKRYSNEITRVKD